MATTPQISSPASANPGVINNPAVATTVIPKKQTTGPKKIAAIVDQHPAAQAEIKNQTTTVNVESREPATAAGTETTQDRTTPAAEKEKKKKFGEVVKGIFSKKEKKQDPKDQTVLEAPQPATNRQSTKRNTDNEQTGEPNNEALANMVDITSNAPDSWMMGVSGLKVTIRNRNNTALQTAAVQVMYYDENDQLLDRKSVYFNNVPAKGKATMPAPDHKFADHVEFKLLAVSAREDHYASN